MIVSLFLLVFLITCVLGVTALIAIAWHVRHVIGVAMVVLAGLVMLGVMLLGIFTIRTRHRMMEQSFAFPSGHFTIEATPMPSPSLPLQASVEMKPVEVIAPLAPAEPQPVLVEEATSVSSTESGGPAEPIASESERDTEVAEVAAEPTASAAPSTEQQAELHASTEVGDLQTQSVPDTNQNAVEAAPAVTESVSVAPAPESIPAANVEASVVSAATASDTQVSSPPVTTETPPSTPAPPSWVVNPPDRIYNHPAMVLVSDPFETGVECDRDIERLVRHTYQLMANEQCRQLGIGRNFPVSVSAEDIAAVLRDRYSELRSTSLGTMRQVHQLVVFDDRVQAKLQRDVRQAMVVQRTQGYGLAGSIVLACVTGLYGLSRIIARRSPDPIAAELLKV